MVVSDNAGRDDFPCRQVIIIWEGWFKMNNNGVIHVRVDDRLIHGQVAVFWCNSVGATRIMVANDDVACNEIQKAALRLVVPAGLSSSIIPVDTAIKNINAGKYAGQRVILVVKSPIDLLRMVTQGVQINEINTGNLSAREGTVNLKKNVNVTPEELEAYKKLNEKGIKLTAKLVPDSSEDNLMMYINRTVQ